MSPTAIFWSISETSFESAFSLTQPKSPPLGPV